MSNSESLRAAEAEILAAFQRFDVNKDGRISEAELVAILTRETSQRASLSPDEAKQLFAEADLDRAGHVEYQKFAAAWATHLAVRADTRPLLTDPEATGLAARADTRPPHFGPEALLKSVESGAIAPLRGRWVVDLDANDGRLKRRQDLPPEAFFPADELRRLTEALGDDYGLLFAGLSYRWLSKENPDPDGFHLKIVAKVARLYMHEDELRSPLTAAFADKGLGAPDFALFWDFASLFQKPREEPEQVELFKEGLKASNVWYGHETTVCWMQTELPPGFCFDEGIAQTYDESGWCFVEAAISAGLKVGKRRLDLKKRTDEAMRGYGGRMADYFPGETLEGVCAVARPPPLLPDEVRRRLEQEKKFTAKADVGVVDGLYRDFFGGAADSATQLDFSGLRWGEAEAKQLEVVLPHFTQLKTLDLSQNELGAAGASAIVSLLKTTQISSLNVGCNGIMGDAAEDLATVVLEHATMTDFCGIPLVSLRENTIMELDLKDKGVGVPGAIVLSKLLPSAAAVKSLNLANNAICGVTMFGDQRGTYTAEGITKLCEGLKGSAMTSLNLRYNNIGAEGAAKLAAVLKETKISNLELFNNNLGPEGGAALAEGLKGNSTLQSLDLCNNQIGDQGVSALAAILKETKISELYLEDNRLGPEGGAALAEGLKGNSTLQSLKLYRNNLGPEGGAALAEGLKGNSTLQSLNLGNNELCGLDWGGRGTYTAEGITKLCEGLKGSAVTSLECAAAP